ncbi:MAG: hypothetical protein ABEJ94_06825 [Halorientalis sp.]
MSSEADDAGPDLAPDADPEEVSERAEESDEFASFEPESDDSDADAADSESGKALETIGPVAAAAGFERRGWMRRLTDAQSPSGSEIERYKAQVATEMEAYDVRLSGCDKLFWTPEGDIFDNEGGYREITVSDVITDDNGDIEEVRTDEQVVTNVDIDVEAVLEWPDADRETQLEITVRPAAPRFDAREMQVPMSAFQDSRSLREQVLAEVPGAVLETGQSGVNQIKRIVSAQMSDAPTRRIYDQIQTVGIDADDREPRAVTPKGAIGADGWVEDDADKWAENAPEVGAAALWEVGPEDVADPDAELVKEVAEGLARLRGDNHDRWLPVLGYIAAAPFRELITGAPRSGTSKWPILKIRGQTGAGKSSANEFAAAAMAGLEPGSDLTKSAMTSGGADGTFNSTKAAPLWLDEYNPSNMEGWKVDKLHGCLKDTSTGATTHKGTPDQSRYIEYERAAPAIVLGEERFPDSMPALARRSIEVAFLDGPTQDGADAAARFKRLQQLRDANGTAAAAHHTLAYWSYAVRAMGEREAMIEEWRAARDAAERMLEERGCREDISEEMRLLQAQLVVFGVGRFRDFAEAYGASEEKLPGEAEIADALEYMQQIKEGEDAASKNNQDRFIEQLAEAASANGGVDEYEGGNDYVAVGETFALVGLDADSRTTELRIHLRSARRAVSKYQKDYGIGEEVPSKADLQSWFKQAAQNASSYVEAYSQPTAAGMGGKRCIGVDLRQVCEELDVQPGDFVPEPAKRLDWVGEESGGEDDAGEDSDTAAQAERVETIEELVDAMGEVTIDDLAAAAKTHGIEEDAARRTIERMREQGDLIEVEEGVVA